MPRPAKGPRLWFSPAEQVYFIRDGTHFGRTGCGKGDRPGAEKKLGAYITEKFRPAVRESDLSRIPVAEVLTAYGREHAPNTRGTSPANAGYNIASLVSWPGWTVLSNLRATTCREYAKFRRKPVMKGERLFPGAKDATIRRELTTLSAAIRHWHREHGPLSSIPAVTMPDKPAPKADWLDRQASAQLLAGALGFYRCQWSDVTTRKVQSAWRRDRQAICRHAARFILVGLYTGTRHAAVLGVRWLPSIDGGWIDLDRGVMHRRGEGVGETSKRQPPVRLGRRILAHLRRWKLLDDAARVEAAEIYNRRDLEKRDYLPPAPFINVVAYEGRPIQKLRKPWYAAREFAALKRSITPHILRHTRATWMMQQGVDLWEAAGALGMSVKILEDTYGHHHPDFQKRAAEV
ncbi:tyrosine-type recombinase/integrase [Mesorhizobium huakuii]|uniref:Site-specific integrase n=1 Tax=Mesorhizobium huakuii TaxID=28104 RepID=A0A7G6T0S2_9HYPH|nr:site-specific integrase [Mesorhizobium huakuii]QND60354.1 site-specific integrase [Mesorhizobium huakuii]